MPTIFAIDGAEFADFGAVSQGVLELQTALKALGQGVGDNILRAIVTDGLIGPKTTAATNRALTVHIGAYQAPANFRTGTLSQATVAANASELAQLVDAEAQRRGYNVPTAKVISTVAKVAAAKPAVKVATSTSMVPYTPTSSMAPSIPQASQAFTPAIDSGMSDTTMQIVKWGAIGLGVVIVTAGIYWAIKRPAGAMAGFGAGDFYHTDPKEFKVGDRVQLHPGTDQWMRGDRYGVVKSIGKYGVKIATDHGLKLSYDPSLLAII